MAAADVVISPYGPESRAMIRMATKGNFTE